jgi:hypothetical protein
MYDQMVSDPPHGAGMDQASATETIIKRISETSNNEEFLATLNE